MFTKSFLRKDCRSLIILLSFFSFCYCFAACNSGDGKTTTALNVIKNDDGTIASPDCKDPWAQYSITFADGINEDEKTKAKTEFLDSIISDINIPQIKGTSCKAEGYHW